MDVDLSQYIVKCDLDGVNFITYDPKTYSDNIIISITRKGHVEHKNYAIAKRKEAIQKFLSKSKYLVKARLLTGKYIEYNYYYIDENENQVSIGLKDKHLLDEKRYK